MTMVSYDARIDRQSRRSSIAAPLIQASVSLAERFWAWRRQRLEARALEFLPTDLRKDLGWPGADRLTQRKP